MKIYLVSSDLSAWLKLSLCFRSDSLPQPHVSLNHRALPAVPCRQANGVGEGNDLCLTRESSISELYATVDKSVGVPPAVPEKTVVITQFNSTGNQHCYSTIDDYSANNGVKQAVSGKNVSVLQVNESTADKPVGNRPLLVNNIA